VPFASPRSKIPALSPQIEVVPSGRSMDCRRLYSEVAAAPTGSTPCSSVHLHPKLAAAVPKVLPDPTSKDLRILKSGRLLDLSSQVPSTPSLGKSQGSSLQDSDGWTEVREKHWWRKSSSFTPANNQEHLQLRRERFLKHMEGKCFRCLSTNHKVAECRESIRCWLCLRFGHLASNCARRRIGYKLPAVPQV
jgi:hypothetical protein